MSRLRVLIIDDEPLARRRLQLVLAHVAGVEIVGEADGVEAALEAIVRTAPDVLLLDIRMRDGTGFDVLDRLPPECAPIVIFVTAFDDSAVRAFDISAVDYLLKPVDATRLTLALDRAGDRLEQLDTEERMAELHLVVTNLRAAAHGDDRRGPPRLEREFWIRGTSATLFRLDVNLIQWAGIEDDYVRLHTATHSYLMRESIQGLAARLDPTQFVRVHRATIVRLTAIEFFGRVRGEGLTVTLRSGARLVAGRVYARALRKHLMLSGESAHC